MKPSTFGRYKHIILRKDNKAKGFSIHRLVALAFIPNPESKPEVNHIDGNKDNNYASNFEWCNASENALHALSLGLRKSVKGEKHGRSILREDQAKEIKYSPNSTKDLAKLFGVSFETVWQIRNGKRWKHI